MIERKETNTYSHHFEAQIIKIDCFHRQKNYVATLTFHEKSYKRTIQKMMIAELNNKHKTYKTTHPAPYGYSFFINETHFYEFSEVKETNFQNFKCVHMTFTSLHKRI